VMSARYDAPGGQEAHKAERSRALDSATMWESLNGGKDPTENLAEDPAEDPAEEPPADPAPRQTAGPAEEARTQ